LPFLAEKYQAERRLPNRNWFPILDRLLDRQPRVYSQLLLSS